MDLLNSTLVLYLMAGVGVAAAVYLAAHAGTRAERWFWVVTAVPFWPLYVPVLLHARGPVQEPQPHEPLDDMAAGIEQVEGELQAALNSLGGWAEGVLTREKGRLGELRSAWTAQAHRIREMDRLLSLPRPAAALLDESTSPRLLQSEQARQRNLERIGRLRERAYDELMGTLAGVRELVSMIHLAKFTGAPASRAEELVAQIAAAVEGLSEVAWQEEASPNSELGQLMNNCSPGSPLSPVLGGEGSGMRGPATDASAPLTPAPLPPSTGGEGKERPWLY